MHRTATGTRRALSSLVRGGGVVTTPHGTASPVHKSYLALRPASSSSVDESHLSGTAAPYIEEMYESWTVDPKSVHASWDAYFRGSHYTPPPNLANTKANEIPLSALAGAFSGVEMGSSAKPSSKVIDAHLAVQATIRSYQVRGHLAAQTDPLNLNNMNRDDAQKLIIRSVTVQEADMDSVFQLPSTTWIGGKVPTGLLTRGKGVYYVPSMLLSEH